MSAREWEPGTVAVATYCGEPNVRVSRYADRMVSGWVRLTDPDDFVNDTEALGEHRVTDIRPLVVLDPEDREQVERLHTLWCQAIVSKGTSSRQIDSMQAALREYANPTPPTPAEPTGLGAVVEDRDGIRWVRSLRADIDSTTPWRDCNDDHFARAYADINAVRVLSEGVTA